MQKHQIDFLDRDLTSHPLRLSFLRCLWLEIHSSPRLCFLPRRGMLSAPHAAHACNTPTMGPGVNASRSDVAWALTLGGGVEAYVPGMVEASNPVS
jgi:hypothetical protein